MRRFLTLFLLLFASEKADGKNISKYLTSAISEVIENFFIEKSIRLDILTFDCGDPKWSDDIISEVSKKVIGLRASEIRTIDKNSTRKSIEESAIVFCDSEMESNKFLGIVGLRTSYGKKFEFLVVLANLKPPELRAGFHGLQFYSFLTSCRGREALCLYTGEYYSELYCGIYHVRGETNRFSTDSLKWSTENYFADNIVKFYNCTVTVAIPHSQTPYTDYRYDHWTTPNDWLS